MIHLGHGHAAERAHDNVAVECSAPVNRLDGSASSRHPSFLTWSGEPVSLLAAIAHELKMIGGGNEAELRLRARRFLTDAFHSLETHVPGAPPRDTARAARRFDMKNGH